MNSILVTRVQILYNIHDTSYIHVHVLGSPHRASYLELQSLQDVSGPDDTIQHMTRTI